MTNALKCNKNRNEKNWVNKYIYIDYVWFLSPTKLEHICHGTRSRFILIALHPTLDKRVC